jgi:putative hydrolase of the HAD superfamily
MIHVGDHKEFDYLSPQNLGITSYYLDRKENTTGNHVVSDLKQFENKILKHSFDYSVNQMEHI